MYPVRQTPGCAEKRTIARPPAGVKNRLLAGLRDGTGESVGPAAVAEHEKGGCRSDRQPPRAPGEWRSGRGVGQVFHLDDALAARQQQRRLALGDRVGADDALAHVAARRDLVHHLEQHLFDQGAQAAGAGLVLQRALGRRLEGVLGEYQLDLVQGEELAVLLGDRVARLDQDAHQRALVQRLQADYDRQPADELRDQPVFEQVVGVELLEEVRRVLLGAHLGAEADRAPAADALADDVLEPLEGAAADEQDVRSVDLQEVLVRMLAAALGRNVGDGALEDLQQRLLDALARYVAGDRRVVALARDLVDLVDVDDAALGSRNVEVGRLDQAEQDVLDVLADVAGLGESRRVGEQNGTSRILASVWASSVLPQPVGPTSRMLLFCSSTSSTCMPALTRL